jgi:nucleotide-binding universal stress UspA family protein
MSAGRIIVGFDGSECSWHALDYAATEAVTGAMVLRLVHSLLNAEDYTGLAAARPSLDAASQARRLVDYAQSYLRNRYPRLQVQVVVTDRPAASALTVEARTAAMLVVGRRGRRGFLARLAARHFGSVGERVAAHASCPVVVIGQPMLGLAGSVVLGVDAADPLPAAIAFAFEAAERRNTDLRAEYVWTYHGEWPTGPTMPSGTDYRTDQAQGRRMLSEALAGWRPAYPDVPVAMDVVHGLDPAARLLDVATDASLLVVGSRNRSGPGEHAGRRPLAASSVADILVRNAQCPVAVVHGTPDRDTTPQLQPG